METIHIELSDERGNVRVLKVLPKILFSNSLALGGDRTVTYASTLEKSAVGDITKLSAVLDQAIRCCIPGSSNMLEPI